MFGEGWKWRFSSAFSCFFFSPLRVNSKIIVQGTKNTVHALFTYCSYPVHGSHDIIYTFKNYFATVFSVFSFSNNKFNPNGPIIYSHSLCIVLLSLSFYNIERHLKKWTFVTYDQILDRGIINKNTHIRYYIHNRLWVRLDWIYCCWNWKLKVL